MKINESLRNDLNLVLNEASILDIVLNENENFLSCKFELLRETENQNPNYVYLKLENLKRFISTLRTDVQNENKILKFQPNQISEYLKRFICKEIYGWQFFNVENSNFSFDELSFEYIKSKEYNQFDSLELFQDDFNDDIEIKIWFESFNFFDENNNEINIQNLIERQDKIWNYLFKK